jgi:hypothetical protein
MLDTTTSALGPDRINQFVVRHYVLHGLTIAPSIIAIVIIDLGKAIKARRYDNCALDATCAHTRYSVYTLATATGVAFGQQNAPTDKQSVPA